jgi:hypothetical protein
MAPEVEPAVARRNRRRNARRLFPCISIGAHLVAAACVIRTLRAVITTLSADKGSVMTLFVVVLVFCAGFVVRSLADRLTNEIEQPYGPLFPKYY